MSRHKRPRSERNGLIEASLAPKRVLAAFVAGCENSAPFATACKMKFLYDLFPLLLFFAAFKFYDIYVATAVAIAASFLQTGLFWLTHRRFETMHLITLGVIAVFGGLTLALVT